AWRSVWFTYAASVLLEVDVMVGLS
ncbi:hypothetical protein NPIL_362951, partial [Nephila pilipes]